MIDRETGWYFTPTSIKAVVVRGHEILLCRNPRDEWELPGGWPDRHDHSLEDTVRREVFEESGLIVDVHELLTARLFRVVEDSPVVLVVFRAAAATGSQPIGSHEHSAVAFFPGDCLPDAFPDVYRSAVKIALDRS